MLSRNLRRQVAGLVAICILQVAADADEFCLDMTRPACGKVCKLVCETKKLTSIGYGVECKSICVPDASREGCKHCAVCFGKNPGDGSCNCEPCPPKCEFCWRDWFACGCAQPQTVKVLTKYQAEKKICWYHWEVVDAACCDCGESSEPVGPVQKKTQPKQAGHIIYKSAPENSQLGETLPVSEEEWVKLAAILKSDPNETAASQAANKSLVSDEKASSESARPDSTSKAPSLADRLERMLKK